MLSCLVVSNSFVIPWTVARQAPLSTEFSRQEYWSGLPFPSPGDIPDPGVEPDTSCVFCIGRQILYHWATWEALTMTFRLDIMFKGFPGGSESKESACNAGDLGSVPGLRRSHGGGHGNPLQYSCLENPCGQRSLLGYSPWGRKELDMPEW